MATRSTLGKYTLIAELGHGGMADVYLAVQSGPQGLGFSKQVVVKCLRPNLAEDTEFIAMLVDEARIAARLNHPNAVQTYEIGESDGQYFIAMEYLDGQPLSRIATRATKNAKPIALAHQLSIYADVLAGLHHAHDLTDYDGSPLGIVHRDVSPHNVFVTYDGETKIVDFGIAKAAGRASQTEQGVVKGKVVYMAPEQASAQDVDRRTDVFAVGIMLWETLTGTRMWKGYDEIGVMARLIARDLPGPPSSAAENVDPELDEICKKALAPKKEDRWATAEEMHNAIVAYLRKTGQQPLRKEVGRYVAELFEDRRKSTREVIESQLADLQRKSEAFQLRKLPGTSKPDQEGSGPTSVKGKAPTSGASAKTPVVVSTPPPAAEAETKVGTGSEKIAVASASLRPSSPGGRPSRSRATFIGIALAATAAAIFGVVALKGSPSTTSSGTTPVPSASSAGMLGSAAPTAESTVTVMLSADSPGTTFQIDHGPAVATPFVGHYKKDNETHVVTALAPGCEMQRHEVKFIDDVTWNAQLVCKAEATNAKAVATAPPTGRATVAAQVPAKPRPDEPAATATTTTAPATTPTPATSIGAPLGPRKRPIDEDDPYAKKK